MSLELSTLTGLKRGSIDSVITSLNEIAQALQQLQSAEAQQILIQCRKTEVGAK